jgi:hypothetical protein
MGPATGSVRESAKSIARLAVDSAIRAGLLGFVLALIILSVSHAMEHDSSAYWALKSVWENAGSILGYSLLSGLVFAAIGAPIGVIVNFRRSADE